MTRPFPRIVALLTIAATVALVSACATPAPEADPTPSATADAPATDPTPAPDATDEPGAEATDEPNCENILSATTVTDFESLGWTALADVFRVGSVEIPTGVQCIWGDFSTATDHVQIFGWAPITAEQAAIAEADLVSDGWVREDSPDGVYVTEKSDTAAAVDDEGYGLTYLFGDGWVKYADTKQGLVLVAFPQS
jgi:hypothetical protein